MADLATLIAFFLACSFIYGLTAFLFRDQIKRDLPHTEASSTPVAEAYDNCSRSSLAVSFHHSRKGVVLPVLDLDPMR
jgi:hypothetical protein